MRDPYDVRLSVTSTGWLTTFQDLGRQDAERLGVPAGGAADRHSAAIANVLVANERRAPLIESLGGVVALTADRDILVSITGAPSEVTIDGTPAHQWMPIVVNAGAELRISKVPFGSRVYIAVAGTIQTGRFLGSAAPDARMGFTQQVLRGSEIVVHSPFDGFPGSGFPQAMFRLPVPQQSFPAGPWTIDAVVGPDARRIPGIRELIESSTYTVTDRSNHVGLRLDGPVLHPEDDTEIVSHGVPAGALEVPHADELIALGRYRTLTAGYPIVGFVTRASLNALGQAGPGRHLRFRWVDREHAARENAAREAGLVTLTHAVRSAFAALGAPRVADHHVI